MTFSQLTPWQLLLWIAAVEMISIPLVVFMCTAINNAKNRAKEQHVARTFAMFGKAFEKTVNDILPKIELANNLKKAAADVMNKKNEDKKKED